MRYYFAGAYERRAELAAYADQLEAAGIGAEVWSRWLTDPQEGLGAGFSAGQLDDPKQAAVAWKYGERDLIDLTGCEAIVSFTGQSERGGRHVEHGVALDMRIGSHPRMRLIVIGPREHVFHCHPMTEVYDDFDLFLQQEIDNYFWLNREAAR